VIRAIEEIISIYLQVAVVVGVENVSDDPRPYINLHTAPADGFSDWHNDTRTRGFRQQVTPHHDALLACITAISYDNTIIISMMASEMFGIKHQTFLTVTTIPFHFKCTS